MQKDPLARQFERILQEGGGLWSTAIVFPENVQDLVAAAEGGDRTATRLVPLLQRATAERKFTGCLLCAGEFANGAPAAFVIVAPDVDTPRHWISHGICGARAISRWFACSKRVCEATVRRGRGWPSTIASGANHTLGTRFEGRLATHCGPSLPSQEPAVHV